MLTLPNLFIAEAHAETVAPAAPAGAPPAMQMQDVMAQVLQMVLIFGVLYLFLIYPQQKKFKQHKAMLDALRRGDKVVTGGGIIGSVVKVEENDEVLVEIASNVQVKVTKASITSVQAKTEPTEASTEKK